MPDELRDLWPSVIDTSVISPIAILKYQASQLRDKTQGLLEAAIRTFTSDDKLSVYDFQIIAPALDRYTYVLFQTWHKPDFVYPVSVRFEPWIEEAKKERGGVGILTWERPSGIRTASSPSEFFGTVREITGV